MSGTEQTVRIGLRIKTRRMELGLTQTAVSRRASLTQSELSGWERQGTNSVTVVRRLAYALRVEPAWLAWGIEPKTGPLAAAQAFVDSLELQGLEVSATAGDDGSPMVTVKSAGQLTDGQREWLKANKADVLAVLDGGLTAPPREAPATRVRERDQGAPRQQSAAAPVRKSAFHNRPFLAEYERLCGGDHVFTLKPEGGVRHQGSQLHSYEDSWVRSNIDNITEVLEALAAPENEGV